MYNARLRELESGQSMAVVVLLVIIVLTGAAIAVDLGCALLERSHQMTILQDAESKCMLPETAVIVKNADNPGPEMCEALTGYLRDAGFTGEIEAYYYEPDRTVTGLAENRRLYLFGATITSKSPTIFAGMLGIEVPVTKTLRWTNAQPYASEKTYVPSAVESGIYRVSENEASGIWAAVPSVSDANMPGVEQELAFALSRQPARV